MNTANVIPRGNPSGGSFRIAVGKVDPDMTGKISATANGDDVQAKLEAIPRLNGIVSVTGPEGGPWTVSYNGDIEDDNIIWLSSKFGSTAGLTGWHSPGMDITYGDSE